MTTIPPKMSKVPMMVYSHGGFSRCFRIARRYQVDGPPVGVRYDDDKAAASGQPAAIAEETAWKEGWIILRDYYYYATPLMTYLLLFLFLWMINMEEDLVNDVSVPLAYMQQSQLKDEWCRKKGAILRLRDFPPPQMSDWYFLMQWEDVVVQLKTDNEWPFFVCFFFDSVL